MGKKQQEKDEIATLRFDLQSSQKTNEFFRKILGETFDALGIPGSPDYADLPKFAKHCFEERESLKRKARGEVEELTPFHHLLHRLNQRTIRLEERLMILEKKIDEKEPQF